MYQKIDHVGIVVFDIASSVAWYAKNLGWMVHHEEYIEDVGAKVAYLLPGAGNLNDEMASLQLVEPIEPSPVLDHLTERGEGIHHICFEVRNLADAVDGLREDPERIFNGGRNQLACFLTDSPNGILIELTERIHAPVDVDQT